MNVVDSSGWIEYFRDSPRANWFASVIEDRAQLLVPTISLFEVHRILSRTLPGTIIETCLDVMRRGRVLDLTDRRAIAASETATRHGLAPGRSRHLQHGAGAQCHAVDTRCELPGANGRQLPCKKLNGRVDLESEPRLL